MQHNRLLDRGRHHHSRRLPRHHRRHEHDPLLRLVVAHVVRFNHFMHRTDHTNLGLCLPDRLEVVMDLELRQRPTAQYLGHLRTHQGAGLQGRGERETLLVWVGSGRVGFMIG